MAQTVQPQVFINYISQRKKICVNDHNQPSQLLIQTDYYLNDTLYFKVINVNNQIVQLDSNTTYQLYGTYIDAKKQVHVLFYTLGVTPTDNTLSFLVNTYTSQYLAYVKNNRTPIDISIVAKQTTSGGGTRSYMVLRDSALANPRGYIEGQAPTDIVYQNVFNSQIPVSTAFGAGNDINLAQDLDEQQIYSFAFGDTLSTNNTNQFVIGYNNEPDATKAFIVANSGNIFTVDYEGNVEAGDLNVGAISATSITVSGEDINSLVDEKVEYLSTAVDDKLSATEDWVSDTFETKESATQTFNELEGEIDDISAFVSGLPTDIAAKADQTDLDEANQNINTISGQVEYLSGAIDQNISDIGDLNTAVGSKANQTDLEALSTTVEGLAETKANLSAIPTKTSDLTNDSGYITLADVPEGTIYGAGFGLAASGDANNIFYLTGTVLSGSEHISVANNVISLIGEVGKTYTGGTGIEVDNTNNTISLSTTIPSAISDLTNDSQFATSAQVSSIVTGYNYLSSITISYYDQNEHEDVQVSAAGLKFSTDFNIVIDSSDNFAWIEWKGFYTQGGGLEEGFNARNIQWMSDFDVWQSDGGIGVALANPIPTAVSDLTNDSGYQTAAQVSAIASGYAGTGGITSAQVSAIVTGYNYITGITVSYNDEEWTEYTLSGKGISFADDVYFEASESNDIVNVVWKGVKIAGGSESIDMYSKRIDWSEDFRIEDWQGDVYISLANPIPLSTSELTNDSGFITASDLPSTVYDKLSAGSNITLTKNNQTGVTTIAATGGGGSYPTIKWNDDYDGEVSYVASSIIFDGFNMGYLDQQGATDVYVSSRGIKINDGEYEDIRELDFDSSEFNISSSEDYVYVSLANPIPSAISDLTNDSEFATSAQVSSIVNNYVTVSGIATGTGLYYNTSDKSLNVNLSADANSNMTISADNNGVVWLSSTGGGTGGVTSAQVSAIVTGYNYISAIPVSYVEDEEWVWTNVSGLQFDHYSFETWTTDNYLYIMGKGPHFHDSEDNDYSATDVYLNSDFSISPGDGEVYISLANPIPLSTSQLTNDSGFITGYTAGNGIAINNGVISCTVEGGDIKTNKQSISTGSTYNEKIEIVLNEYTPVNSAITLSAFDVPNGALESGVATFEEWVYTTDAFSGVNTTNDVTFIGDTPDEFLPSAYHVFSRRLVNVNGTIKQFVSFAYQFESPIIYVPTDPINSPLTFTAKAATANIKLVPNSSPLAVSLQYSLNGGEWTEYSINSTINLNQNDTVAFSGNNDHFSYDSDNYYNFQMTGAIEAGGNIQSLMNYNNSCTNYCYMSLFKNCQSLLTAPYLPATTLAYRCYREMFANCSNLSSINISFTDWTGATDATLNWVNGVAANGTFTKPAALSTEYGDNRIPTNWTVVNK